MVAATPSSNYAKVNGHIIPYSLKGIPCQIQIDECTVYSGSYHPEAPSDLDYYGYSEIEFTLLDRKGYPAAWLERKLNELEEEKIQLEILRYAEAY